MAVNALETTLRVCYCPTTTFAQEHLVVWPVVCLSWLPCTEHQSCEHLSPEGIFVGPFKILDGSQSLGSNFFVCYCPTTTIVHELLVIWPVACLAWLPCTGHQSCEHSSHEGISVGPFGISKWQSTTSKQLYVSVIALQGPLRTNFW